MGCPQGLAHALLLSAPGRCSLARMHLPAPGGTCLCAIVDTSVKGCMGQHKATCGFLLRELLAQGPGPSFARWRASRASGHQCSRRLCRPSPNPSPGIALKPQPCIPNRSCLPQCPREAERYSSPVCTLTPERSFGR